jgi:hypothetical protein
MRIAAVPAIQPGGHRAHAIDVVKTAGWMLRTRPLRS